MKGEGGSNRYIYIAMKGEGGAIDIYIYKAMKGEGGSNRYIYIYSYEGGGGAIDNIYI